VLGNQVIATLGEQTQDRGVVLELDAVEAPVVLGDRSNRDGVGDVGLAGVV
jgi:ABC-type xylose transport system permease subunit